MEFFCLLPLKYSRDFHLDYLICLPNIPVRWEQLSYCDIFFRGSISWSFTFSSSMVHSMTEGNFRGKCRSTTVDTICLKYSPQHNILISIVYYIGCRVLFKVSYHSHNCITPPSKPLKIWTNLIKTVDSNNNKNLSTEWSKWN